MRFSSLFVLLTHVTVALSNVPVVHFTIARRGGPLHTSRDADLPALAAAVSRAEAKYGLTRREVKGNKLVRKPKQKAKGGKTEQSLMTEVGEEGRWYAILQLGDPPQRIEMDLDMLSCDFYLMSTTSSKGTPFNVFGSKSFKENMNRVHPMCDAPSDKIYLPTINETARISFPQCKPSKYSRWTLTKSGAVLGLAPSTTLKQVDSRPLIDQLLEHKLIDQNIWSVALINGREGILSIGGTAAELVDDIKAQTEKSLASLGKLAKRNAVDDFLTQVKAPKSEEPPKTWRDEWRWSNVEGAEGWWQILLEGVWIDGSKILKNQPAVIDLNSPFILAPPLAARKFYESIPSARRLPAPHDQFYVFPCLNPPSVHFEFGHWLFPAFQGSKGVNYTGAPGGKLSLGRLRRGSGYCVGAVVETRMGVKDDRDHAGGKQSMSTGMRGQEHVLASLAGEIAGNGMRGVWVIGEGFFRGVGGVFDFEQQKVGFRTY